MDVLLVCLCAFGCQPTREQRDETAYGDAYADHDYCQGLVDQFESNHAAQLGQHDINQLLDWTIRPDRVSYEASAALALYATNQSDIKAMLLAKLPTMFRSSSPNVLEAAGMVAARYHAKGMESQAIAAEARIKVRHSSDFQDMVALDAIDRYLLEKDIAPDH